MSTSIKRILLKQFFTVVFKSQFFVFTIRYNILMKTNRKRLWIYSLRVEVFVCRHVSLIAL